MKIGIVADPQYGDLEDGATEDRVQRYRPALEKTREALRRMQKDCDVIIQLGDIVQSDRSQTRAEIERDFDSICRVFEEETIPGRQKVLHTLGNHCVGRLSRAAVCKRLNIPGSPSSFWSHLPFTRPSPQTSYYSHTINRDWKVIVLDTTEMSGHSGYPADSRPAREAMAYLARHPVEQEPHMIPWNGGCTKRQLNWLKKQLSESRKNGTKLILAMHHPMHPGAARPSHLAWNFNELMAITTACPNVRLVLSGHDHLGGACRQPCTRAGSKVSQLYVTVPAILEAAVEDNEYVIVDLDDLERMTSGHGVTGARPDGQDLIQCVGEKSRTVIQRAGERRFE